MKTVIRNLRCAASIWLCLGSVVALSLSACATEPPPATDEPTPTLSAITAVPLGAKVGWIANYKFNVTLDYAVHRASIVQTVEVLNPGPDTWTQVMFQLPTALRSPESFALSNITISDGAITYQKKNGLIMVNLPRRVVPNSGAAITFNYALTAPNVTLDTRPPLGNVGYNKDLIQFINWYPVLTPYRNGAWLLVGETAADPLPADPLFTDVADYELNVSTTESAIVVSGGAASRSGGNWKFTIKNARTIHFIASQRYQSQTQKEGSVTLASYYLPEHAGAGQEVLKAAGQALRLLVDRFGPYPYTSLVMAENAYLGSATGGGLILHVGQGYADFTGQPDSLLISLLPQAMARLWWGQAVQGDAYTQPWLNESWPMYSELLFYQAYYPKLEPWYWEARVNYWQPSGNLDRAAAQFSDTEDYTRNLLRRGALFLREVRASLGEEAFMAFGRDLFASSNGRTLTATDFFVALRRQTTLDLNPLLTKYFAKQTMPTVGPTRGAPTATPFTHIVKAGETLGGIAKFYGVTVEAIVQANKLPNADAIYAGQRLLIPK